MSDDYREFEERLDAASGEDREEVRHRIEEHFQHRANERFLETGEVKTEAAASVKFSETPEGQELIEWRNRAAGWSTSASFDEPTEEERDAEDDGSPWEKIQIIASDLQNEGLANSFSEGLELALQRNPELAAEYSQAMRGQ